VIGLDTNVLVRYLTKDDDKQFQEASALLLGLEKRQRSAYLSSVTLCETVWVLARAYKIDRAQIVEMFVTLLDTSLFVIEDKDAVREAVDLYRSGKGDFADYLVGIRSRNAGSVTMATFDVALHAHSDLFSAPAAALRKGKPSARGHVVRRPSDAPGPRRQA
jgi:predicted nucleic-acid-binding protein